MKRVVIIVARDGKQLTVQVQDTDDPEGNVRGVLIKDIDKLVVLDRRLGGTAVISGEMVEGKPN